MAKERLKSPRARMFVALDIPDEVRAGIAAWQEREAGDPALRRVAPEGLHVTLAFLGHTPEREVGRLRGILVDAVAAWRQEGGPPADGPRIELLGVESRPPRGRPRLYAIAAASPDAVAVQGEVERRLVEARLYEPEKRPFWPHVTVARVRREARGSSRPAAVERPPRGLPAGLREPFRAVRATLYRSELQPQGARYTPLAQVELSGDGRQ